jgi:hypothetical protein
MSRLTVQSWKSGVVMNVEPYHMLMWSYVRWLLDTDHAACIVGNSRQ